MNRLEEISKQRQRAHNKLLSMKSEVYQSFLEMEKVTYSDGALPKKTKELIAIGISVVTDCESCMQWHIEQAAKAGADEKQIMEAIEVGMEMACGRATVSARFALDVMDNTYTK